VIAITLLSLGGGLRLPRADASGSFLLFAARRNRFREVAVNHSNRLQARGVVTPSLEEVAPFAAEVATNVDLLKRFEDVAFGDDSRRIHEVGEEITAFVRTFYPSLTDDEGHKVQLILANMIGRRKGKF
jgi:hypothetical protein